MGFVFGVGSLLELGDIELVDAEGTDEPDFREQSFEWCNTLG